MDTLLDRIADTLNDLIPYDTLSIYQADETQTVLIPVLARDRWADEIMGSRSAFGEGITGWAAANREPVLTNAAHLDPRVKVVPGTPPDEPEALITVPLIARDVVKGVLNIYRLGDAEFNEQEFELAIRFGDAAALAIDNAQIRARLEYQAQTDSLTSLFNHRFFHDRLRAELTRASRSHDSVAVLMLDIDDFKKVNDIYGHGTGDYVLAKLAELLRGVVRASDVVCRLGGEEFGVIMPSCSAADAYGLACRLTEQLEEREFGPAGKLTLSIGIAQGPEHAMNPRELAACAEAAMMTSKARGKNLVIVYDEATRERPANARRSEGDVRSIAHLKMLQSLAGKLNRLNDVREIGNVIANELRLLIDYHNCRVSIVEGDEVVPIAFRGELSAANGGEDVHLPRTKVGEGVTGRAAATGRPELIANALECDYAVMIPGTHKIEESLVAVPLCYGTRVNGVIVISKLGVEQFDEDDVRLLEVLAGQAAVALENARLYEAQRREAEHLKELLEFSRELATAEGLPEVLARVVELSAKILGSARNSVWLQDPESGDLLPTALTGYDQQERERVARLRIPGSRVEALVATHEPFLVEPEQLHTVVDAAHLDQSMRYSVAPVHLDGGRLCCILAAVPAEEVEDFRQSKMTLLAGLAHQARLAITNAGSFENLETTFVSTVEALANALEANDEYTSSHTRSITDMALKVGERLGFDAKALKQLELGALFHDIGKIGIPATILLKPGPLTAEERTVMEMHPELGERILAPIERLAEVRAIVRSCHERYDGRGYPDGKTGEEIPLEARIILVCDAFHAMTTDRPYRKRLSADDACRRLRAGAGAQFDPGVVDVFLALPVEDRVERVADAVSAAS